jgi:hypothetical protein
MRNRVMVCGLVVLALVACGKAAAAQDADMKELSAYRLTKENLDRYGTVMKALFVEIKKDPRFAEMGKLQAELERLSSKDDPTAADERRMEELEARLEQLEEATDLAMNEDSLSDMEARIRTDPALSAAVKAGGMAPREYAKFTLVLLQASMVVGMQRAGLLKELPKDIAAENVRFVEQHEKELAALQRQMEALGEGRDR